MLHYTTARKLLIFLDKIKMAKKTLNDLILPENYFAVHAWVKDRLRLLEALEADLLYFLTEEEQDLPFNPSERCRAVLSWFASQNIPHNVYREQVVHKLAEGEEAMRTECHYILADTLMPQKIKQTLLRFLDKTSQNTLAKINPLPQRRELQRSHPYPSKSYLLKEKNL